MKGPPVLRRHPMASYYVLALAWTWLVEWPLVAVNQGWTTLKIPFAIHYPASMGPAVAAILVTATTSGASGLDHFARIHRRRSGHHPQAIIPAIPSGISTGLLLSAAETGPFPPLCYELPLEADLSAWTWRVAVSRYQRPCAGPSFSLPENPVFL